MFKKILEENNVRKVLLIDPAFPIANKSRNHKDLLPVGLLKISSYLKSRGIETKLIRLNKTNNEIFNNEILEFNPNFVMVTSVFTYWYNEVKEAVEYSKGLLPEVKVMVGGILASLHCNDWDYDNIPCDYVFPGIVECAEHIPPDYSILENSGEDINFQIIHSSRGCKRKCPFCGVRKIENRANVSSIENELIRKNLVFYDNNLLDNPDIEDLLKELINLREKKKITRCESQSGFDGRMLHKNPDLAKLLKKANFKDPKIAWDGPFKAFKRREKEIEILESAGYNRKEIAVFMLYNHDLSYEELEKKRAKCFEWGVQVSDCRFRPLDRFTDGYNPHKRSQERSEYYIHDNWSDEEVRQFRRNVRRHNICIRHNMKYHSRKAEIKKISKEDSMKIRNMTFDEVVVSGIVDDAWDPSEPYVIKKKFIQTTL